MEKFDPTIKVTELDVKTEQKQRAQDTLDNLPQPSMTAPDATSFTTSGGAATHVDGAATTVLANMRTRINELEDALVRAGIIKSR